MNNKVREHLLSVMLLLTMLLGGCAPAGIPPIANGQVLALQPGYTLQNLFASLHGASLEAQAFTRGNLALIVWPGPGNLWSGACVKLSCQDTLVHFRIYANGNGQAMTAQTMSDLVKTLLAAGWTKVNPAQLATPGLLTLPVFPLVPMPEEAFKVQG